MSREQGAGSAEQGAGSTEKRREEQAGSREIVACAFSSAGSGGASSREQGNLPTEQSKLGRQRPDRSTKNEGPWKLICWEDCRDRESARWLEFTLKRSRGASLKWLERARIFK